MSNWFNKALISGDHNHAIMYKRVIRQLTQGSLYNVELEYKGNGRFKLTLTAGSSNKHVHVCFVNMRMSDEALKKRVVKGRTKDYRTMGDFINLSQSV